MINDVLGPSAEEAEASALPPLPSPPPPPPPTTSVDQSIPSSTAIPILVVKAEDRMEEEEEVLEEHDAMDLPPQDEKVTFLPPALPDAPPVDPSTLIARPSTGNLKVKLKLQAPQSEVEKKERKRGAKNSDDEFQVEAPSKHQKHSKKGAIVKTDPTGLPPRPSAIPDRVDGMDDPSDSDGGPTLASYFYFFQ